MASTDFDLYLRDVEDLEDAYFLDQAIRTESDFGHYDCKKNGERLFISSYKWSEPLLIASDKAKKKFLNDLEKRWTEEGESVSLRYDFEQALQKND